MIKAKHNPFYIWFFRNYFGMLRRIHFRKMSLISTIDIPENHSVLLFQNHCSWWDGYWSYLVSRKYLHRKFHVMMLEKQLRKRMFLNSCGVFSIQKNNRDFLNSLDYTSEILMDPKNLVAIYPAGEMFTQHRQTVQFQAGIERVFHSEHEPFSIVFAVFLTDYFGFSRPEIRLYLENYSGERTMLAMTDAFNSFYQYCVSKQTE